MNINQPKILVAGAAGKLGSLVLFHLTQTYGYPASRIIATTRNPASLEKWSESGIEVRKADFSDRPSLESAFEGAEKLLLISTDSVDNDVRNRQHFNAVEAAKAAGVTHIYYTSLPAPEDSRVSFASVHSGTEKAIKASGLTYTILRNNWYFENLLLSIPGALASGKLFTAAGQGTISYISRNDLAQAAAAALIANSGVDNQTFTLTGTESLSFESVASQVSRALDKPISVIHVPLEAIIEGARSHGLPEPVAVMVASFDVAAKAGNLSQITSDFEALTGRSPQPFEEWLAECKGVFAAPVDNAGVGAMTLRHAISDNDAKAVIQIREFAAPSKGSIGPEGRDVYDQMIEQAPKAEGVTYESGQVGGIDGWWVRPGELSTNSAILYLHGGAYEVGSARAYRNFAGQIASRAGAVTFLPDYRLAPENPFPAAIDDVRAAYHGLVELGYSKIAIAGDSAGGGLALASLALSSDAATRPKAVLALSPWTDLALEGSSIVSQSDADPFLTKAALADAVGRYLGTHNPKDPLASPLYADLRGTPPIRIDVGEAEILLDDSLRYFDKLVGEGGSGELHIWDGLPHVFSILIGVLDAAEIALDEMGSFLREALRDSED